MRRDLLTAAVAVALLTVLLGVAYPLAVTGVAQLAFPDRASGSRVERDGRVVGSRLLAQPWVRDTGRRDADGEPVTAPDPAYFQPRPSQTGYDPAATAFSNRGPNQASAAFFHRDALRAYLALERRWSPGLSAADVPVDAVTTSASGVDPHISQANARIQARRVAAVRGRSYAAVMRLVDEHTDGRFLGVLGEPGVNTTELNLALGGTP